MRIVPPNSASIEASQTSTLLLCSQIYRRPQSAMFLVATKTLRASTSRLHSTNTATMCPTELVDERWISLSPSLPPKKAERRGSCCTTSRWSSSNDPKMSSSLPRRPTREWSRWSEATQVEAPRRPSSAFW